MEQIRYTVILDITDNGCFNTGWRLKQGDGQNIVLDVKVTNNGENYEAENPPRIVFKRPDGYSVIGQMDALTEDFYTYTIVGNEIAVAGNVLMDVKFGEDEDRTSTASCKFEVIPDTIGQSSGGSGIYDNTLAELVEESRINVLLAESYTKGGTGIRSGEETDNARYYKDKAAETVDTVMREYLIENVDYLKNQNRFNPSKVTNGKINIENGNIISDSNYITSDYIPFDLTKVNNSRVKFGASSYGGDDLIVQLYDNQKRNIRTLFYGSLGISWIGTKFMEEVSIPENDVLRYDLVYVRYSLQKDSINPILGNRALFDYSTFGDYKSNKVLSEDLTQIYYDGFASKNSFDVNALTMGYVFNSQGNLIVNSNGYWGYEYVKVEPNTDYVITCRTSLWTDAHIVCFTSAKVFISDISNRMNTSPTIAIHTPSNCEYLGVSVCIANGDTRYDESNVFQVEKGTEATPYTPYAKPNTELTQIVDGNIANGYIDKVGKIEWSIGGLNFADGSENTLNTRARTNFIDVKDIPSLNIEVKPNTQYGIYRYDANKNFINYHAWITDKTQSIPSDAKFVRFVIAYTDTSKEISYLSSVSASIYVSVPSNIAIKEKLTQIVNGEEKVYGNIVAQKNGNYITVGAMVATDGSIPFCPVNCSANAYTTIATLDADFRPKKKVCFGIVTYNPNIFCFAQIRTTGELQIYPTQNLTGNTQLFFNVSFSR